MAENTYIDKSVRITLIIAIIAWSFQMLYPLLGVLAWGFILAVVLYPFYTRLNTWIRKPALTATIITLLALLLVIGTMLFITNDITRTVSNFTTQIHSNEKVVPAPPKSVQQWPLIGEPLNQIWTSTSTNFRGTLNKYSDEISTASKYMLTKLLHTGKDLLLFIVSILFSGFLMVHAHNFMNISRRFAKRVAHERGTDILNIIKSTIQNVSRGVIGIALLQTFLFGLLTFLANVPAWGLLCLLGLILSIVQVGLIILIIPLIAWLFLTKSFVFASIITLFLVLDSLLDSFLKPIVLARGLQTPPLIIFIGVIGGVITYGFIGIFIGPIVLAIAYDLMHRWINVEAYGEKPG